MEASFYKLLFENDEFAMAVGRVALSSAKLESAIKSYIDSNGGKYYKKDPLGKLIENLKKTGKIDRTSLEHLQFILEQRNHFVHRLHSHLSEYPSNEFEVKKFINRAITLSNDMEFFSKIFFDLT